jgi:hypothetical protein
MSSPCPSLDRGMEVAVLDPSRMTPTTRGRAATYIWSQAGLILDHTQKAFSSATKTGCTAQGVRMFGAESLCTLLAILSGPDSVKRSQL